MGTPQSTVLYSPKFHKIVAIAAPEHMASRRVMEKVGMNYPTARRMGFLSSPSTLTDLLGFERFFCCSCLKEPVSLRVLEVELRTSTSTRAIPSPEIGRASCRERV